MSDDQKALHLTDEDFAKTIKEAGKPVFVDFYADWCGPCKMAAPIIDKLAGEYQDKMLITKLNIDENRTTATEYGVMSIPTVMVFKAAEAEGEDEIKLLAKQVGFPGEAGYRNLIEDVIEE